LFSVTVEQTPRTGGNYVRQGWIRKELILSDTKEQL